MCEDTTPEKAAELALDEAGQADPVGARGGGGEEDLQVFLDHRAGPRRRRRAGRREPRRGAQRLPCRADCAPGGRADDARPAVMASGCNTIATERCADDHRNGSPATGYDRGSVMADRW